MGNRLIHIRGPCGGVIGRPLRVLGLACGSPRARFGRLLRRLYSRPRAGFKTGVSRPEGGLSRMMAHSLGKPGKIFHPEANFFLTLRGTLCNICAGLLLNLDEGGWL